MAVRTTPPPSPLPPPPAGFAAGAGTGRPSTLLAACTLAAAAPLTVGAHQDKDRQEGLQSLAEWKLLVYNPTTRGRLGRTAKSWGSIFPLYLALYGFLAALFAFTVWAVLRTLNGEVPKYRDQISSPGLMVCPKPVTALE